MIELKHLASRIFGTPLLIERNKLDVILAAIGPRVGVEVDADTQTYGPGDTGRSRKDYWVTAEGIAIIDVIGPLVKRNSGAFMSGGPTTYSQIESEFADAINDPNVRGVLLQIDSPGGESTGAFELADSIHSARGSKPIYAIADGDAFSAAYALASAADQVYVTKTGGVGSVGVWMMHVDQSGFNAQNGIKPTYIYAGAHKIEGNPHEPLSDEARGVFQDIVDGAYEMFVDAVARNRGMSADAVRATEAGLFWGQPKKGTPSATDIGFADHVGTTQDALAALVAAIAPKNSHAASAAIPPKGVVMEKEETAEPTAAEQPNPGALAPEPEPEPVAAEAPAPNVDAMLAEARAEGYAHAAEILDLCALAKKPGMAAEFVKSRASVADVRAALLNAKADETDADGIDSHAVAGGVSVDALNARAETMAKEKGITKEQAFIQVASDAFGSDPKLYEQYLASSQQPKTK